MRPLFSSNCPRGFRSSEAIMLSHHLQRGRHVLVAFEAMLQARDLEDFPAVVVEANEFRLSKQIIGPSLEPQKRLEALAVHKTGLFKVHDKIDDLPIADPLFRSGSQS